MDRIIIKKSKKADTRSAFGLTSKEELIHDTELHQSDVKRVGDLFCNLIKTQCDCHDHTKIDFIDEFYRDFSTGKTGFEFKDLGWFEKHIQERHHLKDRCPDDVNIIDVLEMIIDCTVAGLARTGEVWPIEIDQEILKKAVSNTSQMIIDSCEIEGDDIDV